jgi:YVTN family beta-propeller protein
MSRAAVAALLALLFATSHTFAATRSTPIELAPDGGTVWVVNPDSNSVAKIDTASNTRLAEYTAGVGHLPRTVAVTQAYVYLTNQLDDSVSRLGLDGTPSGTVSLGFGCAPSAVAVAGAHVYVTCEGPSTLVVLDANLNLVRTVPLPWPEARALAVADTGLVYVTHFLTKEPNHTGHVSEVDPAAGTVVRVLDIPPDHTTCETQASGQGVANLLSAIAVGPGGAVAGQLWVGGTLHNSLRKGLFERSRYFQGKPGVGLFPDFDFQSNPAGEKEKGHRNIYKPALHDIARAAIWNIDLASGKPLDRLDLGGATVSALAFSSAGDAVYAVDLMANGYYVFSTGRGQGTNAATVFGPVAAFGTGGAQSGSACTSNANDTAPEDAYILSPQARLVPTVGMEPLDAMSLMPVDTGLEFTVATGLMRGVPDGVGTTPVGVALSANGANAYVSNYLARNVVVVAATPAGFRCQQAPATPCATRKDCAAGDECMPLVAAKIDAIVPDTDLLKPEILDGKILFTTSARDAAGSHGPIPPFNALDKVGGTTHQGQVTSTARDGTSLACTSCHADFGGTDGRTWDFAQFGSSLRNTMDLRGRASFAPGTCSNDSNLVCTTDSQCGASGSGDVCRGNLRFTPPNIDQADRTRFFNPMGSTHWNGDRDEVEDFEFTLRQLLGASDCDGNEDKPETCVGALVVRRFVTDPADVRVDLSPQPNRHLSPRLDHLGDYVYSLTEFVQNPNLGADGNTPSDAAKRGRLLFNDPVVHCSFCHNGPSPGNQQFTNKGPNSGYDPTQVPRADLNSPFVRFDVGTANLFDQTNPFFIANDGPGLLGFTLFQNEQSQIPGNRDVLNAYITPVLNDVWNTAPYLHDGTAATLLDVVRSCDPGLGDCLQPGKGRNLCPSKQCQHGDTSFLTARQLNDLAAFEKAPHGPIVEERALTGVLMDVRRLKIRFGHRAGTDRLALQGRANLSQGQSFDVTANPLVFSLGIPTGEAMTVVERTLPSSAWKANAAKTAFRFADRRGTLAPGLRKLTLKVKGGRLAFKLAGAGLDLSAIKVRDPDYTVGFEVGRDTAAATRHFKTNRKGTVTKGP